MSDTKRSGHAGKTHCPYGHPYDDENTRVYTYPKTGKTQRVCKACSNERSRLCHMQQLYGVTQEQYDALFAAQGGVCAICLQPAARALDVDHHHDSGTVRGLLCNKHNRALGLFGEDIGLLQEAIRYLEKHQQ